MRPHNSLVHSRTRVTDRYALLPLEGFPFSRLPNWPGADVRILATPSLGANFAEYLIDLPAGGRGNFGAADGIETFFYVTSGTGLFEGVPLAAGSFGLLPPAAPAAFEATEKLSVLVVRKRFQPAVGVPIFEPIINHERRVPSTPWADTYKIQLQMLIPDELQFDLAVNIFAFTPGFGLPIVETHVMEHGALILQGKGIYQLGGEWMEVEKDDFIWMGPFCPQSFYATGEQPAKYIYTKDVNREIVL